MVARSDFDGVSSHIYGSQYPLMAQPWLGVVMQPWLGYVVGASIIIWVLCSRRILGYTRKAVAINAALFLSLLAMAFLLMWSLGMPIRASDAL